MMKKLLMIILISLIGCESNNDFMIKKIDIGGEKYEVKIPKGEKFKKGIYDELQASRIIHLNLKGELRDKIKLTDIEKLINYQGEYIVENQNSENELILMDKKNIDFLIDKMNSIGINLTKNELFDIFDLDNCYAKLIDIIE